ncbi:MAG TPA: cytochrome c biogenesis protein CcdA [Candidatus Syntrophosphaera sp.]|jgi:thiol:disulfide interchange protein DsbD|nr:cytochrome c biogenesis protein CcdA [Candidatus Cloacimonadota bacterium]HOR03381.1 cytochrome c biogenesis protein CcdA [Candidatus Syntrophosphaera sp.]HPK83281.1 cytochrome c biogenesis protein CcdA [Candidatus Syntrophosphaera sp.]HQG94094.1 cytochrome c biogenesis protein CcdA [Candidatus Syntrophosphaera sp.]HQK29290.1 cytochrome c biogenesis protein CcdA [Candidatus Syntrophosphaera sp.]
MRLSAKTLFQVALLAVSALLLSAQSVKFSVSPTQLKPGDKGVLRATLTITDPEKKQSYTPAEGEEGYLYLVETGEYPQLKFGKTSYPAPNHKNSDGIWEYYKSLTLSRSFTVSKTAKPGPITINASMSFNLCNKTSGFCDPPRETEGSVKLEILPATAEDQAGQEGEVAEEQPLEVDSATADSAGQSTETPADAAPAQEKAGGGKIWYYMLLAILGGIVLNFTPCVLPILPIRAMSMVNQAQKDISKVLIHTLVYTLGVLISFGAIAAVFVIARASGVNLTYGFLSQSLLYNLIMMSILFLFGLSLMGVWEMTVPGMNAAAKTTSKKGYGGSFFAGVFAFLMGFSCMGPFMGPALEVAVRLSSPMLVLFFLLIGLGFALPFIIISLFPKALKLVPKPGEWMNIFKELMGFVLMYLTWKYFSNVWGLTKSGPYLMKTGLYLVYLGFAAWLYGRFVRPENKKAVQIILGLAAVAVIAASAATLLPWKEEYRPQDTAAASADGMVPADHPGWYVFSPELFARLQSEGKPVFLDIGADWCTNCKSNEKKVLLQPDIQAEFNKRGVVLLKGDFTREDPVLKDWMQKGGSIGVPFNVLYIPGREPVKMAELFSKADLLKALELIPEKTE